MSYLTSVKMFVRDITVKGVDLTVWFWWYPGYPASDDDPGDAPEIDIDSVFIDEFDIIGLMGEQSIKDVENELFKLFEEGECV